MTSESVQEIGLARIWQEASSQQQLSMRSFIDHILGRVRENILRSPVTSTLTVLTIGVSLSLLGTFLLLIENIQASVAGSSGEMVINLYLKDEVTEADGRKLAASLQDDGQLKIVKYRGKAEALESFRKELGEDAVILDGFDEANPLPASVELEPQAGVDVSALIDKIQKKFSTDPKVEHVRYNRDLADAIKRIMGVVETGGVIACIFLVIVTGFIISNTIRLALYAHRVEVEIMKLVGASMGAIQAPYLIEGSVQGLLGGALGLAIVLFIYTGLQNGITTSPALHSIFPSFHFMSWIGVLLLVTAGVFVGLLGSFLAVRRFLASERAA